MVKGKKQTGYTKERWGERPVEDNLISLYFLEELCQNAKRKIIIV